ncbi:MAG: low CO2-induced protein [Trebouxia sp. A1-2]|nr:MAG: low CO2-induced protein [Trebouxia sp. A1-2]
MRSCFAGRTAFQHTHNFHRRAVVQATLAELKPSTSTQCRRRTALTASSAAVSAPESVREETASSGASKEAAFAVLERAVSVSDAEQPSTASTASSSKRETLESPEQLASTPEHRTLVGSAILLLAAIGGQGVSGIHGPHQAAVAFAAVSAAYVLADFGTGVYHWSVDNYGSGATPIVGEQIAAFQGHHQRPWTITQRQFANNLHKVFKPSIPFSLAWLVASSALHFAPVANCFISVFVFLVCMSQQFHAWGHMKKSELPAAVVSLQNAGLLISRKAHGAHHKAPFEGNYCIVSGLWNEALDQSGSDQGFFRKLERFVAAKTGVEPRCWYEPKYELEQLPGSEET